MTNDLEARQSARFWAGFEFQAMKKNRKINLIEYPACDIVTRCWCERLVMIQSPTVDQNNEAIARVDTVSSSTVDLRQTVDMVALGIGENTDAQGVLDIVFD